MANTIIWNARPTAETVMAADDVSAVGLRNATSAEMATGILGAEEIANGTGLFTHADFLLKLHDFDDVPHAGDYLDLHIFYQFDALWGDGEHGDLGGPVTSANTFHGRFVLAVADGIQHIAIVGVPLGPYDFRCMLKGVVSHDIADTDGSLLYVYRYCLEVQ